MKYVAFLRGINVGGKSLIKMSDLKLAFEKAGFKNATTYINSGNVIFESEMIPSNIVLVLEENLSKTFNIDLKVVLRSVGQIKNTLDNVPKEWIKNNDLRCYMAFIKDPLTSKDLISEITLKEGVDFAKEGDGVVYMTTKLSGIAKSGFSKLASKPVYKQITIRNYNTVQKILAILENH